MKQMNFPLLLLIALFSLNAGCKKENTLEDELAKLPPATQIGANTFGCLVNGKAWVAQNGCRFLCDPPFKLYYSDINGGNIIAIAENLSPTSNSTISVHVDSSNFFSNFEFPNFGRNNMSFIYNNYSLPQECSVNRTDDSTVNGVGKVYLTRFDLNSRIISGTFEFSLSKSGCDTIRVTNGRFDGRLY